MKTNRDFLGLSEITLERLSLIFFIISSIFIIFCSGFMVREFKLRPVYSLFANAERGFEKIHASFSKTLPWYYIRLKKPFSEVIIDDDQPNKGLVLVTKVEADNKLSAEVIDSKGKTIHRWDIDWFKLWSYAKHLPEADIPKEKPGTDIHGAVLMENGDLVFNFDFKGLVRISRDGEVVWRLPYVTHHSIHLHDNGNLWVCGRRYHTERISRLPDLKPPVWEDTIIEVTPEGRILREWFVADILRNSGYDGLLYLGTLDALSTEIAGTTDILHLNDVEPFSPKLREGFFTQGDVIVSLRNINTVFVFNTESGKIKFISTGQFIRQHDPDFIDGYTFSIFDNNNRSAVGSELQKSRIVIVSVQENNSRVFFEGTSEKPFFTDIMGKHQWLPNGNLLITEPRSGRGFEVNQQGEIVWEYINYVAEGVVGLVTEIQRLPIEYNQLFISKE